MERIITYIDGFNLYYGMREAGFNRFYWLDPVKLAITLLKPEQTLVGVKYFTARIIGARIGDPEKIAKDREAKRGRQNTYLEALATLDKLQRFEGHFLFKRVWCPTCKGNTLRPEEKMTDVRIATEMLGDAFDDNFDAVLLVSGDSDLVPPVRKILERFPSKRVIVASPPKRVSAALNSASTGNFVISRRTLSKSQLPERITRRDGYVIERPVEWGQAI